MKRTALAIAIGAVCAGLSGGVLAQQDNQDETDNRNVTTQQQEMSEQDQGSSGSDNTRDITVDQEPAEVEVEQDKPDITVEQSQPEVTIDQPEPDVTVEDAEPDVTVEQTGEPDVTVEQAEDAEVDVNQDEEQDRERQQRDQAEQNNQTDQNGQENALMSQQVSDLEGMTVMNQEDEEIGDVQHIAKHDDSGDLFAIVSVGGIWGFGATDIALPLNNMQFENDQLVVNTNYGEDEIEDSSNDYQEDEYSEVDGDMTLSEAQQQ